MAQELADFVSEALSRDERWRVVIRGTNWLCPYCLKIGARDVRPDEGIEERIAAHLEGACAGWDEANGECRQMDELRKTARFIVFKGRVLRWIAEDPRFRATDPRGRWVCPYCVRPTDAAAPAGDLADPETFGAAPEEDAFVGGAAAHLLRCDTFAKGEDAIASLEAIDAAAKAEPGAASRVRRGTTRAPQVPSPPAPPPELAGSGKHRQAPPASPAAELAGSGKLRRESTRVESRPTPAGGPALPQEPPSSRAELRADLVKARFEKEPSFRLMDQQGRWLCPFCALAQDVRLEGKPRQEFFSGLTAHLERCRGYTALGGTPRPPEELRQKIETSAHGRQVGKIRAKVEKHALWRVRDQTGRWYCPYCAGATTLVVPERGGDGERDPGAIDRFVEGVHGHLADCEAYRRPDAQVKTRGELATAVAAVNRELDDHRRIRALLERDPLFRVIDGFSSWVCPHCRRTEKSVLIDPRAPLADRTVEQVLDHLRGPCLGAAAWAEGAPPRATLQQVEEVARSAALKSSGMRDALSLADLGIEGTSPLEPDEPTRAQRPERPGPPARDSGRRSGPSPSSPSPTARRGTGRLPPDPLDDLLAEHASDQGEVRGSGARSDARGSGDGSRASGEMGASGLGDSLDEQSWRRIRDDLEAVKTRVERAKQRESSLREARTKQLRLLPEVPDVVGLEFARVYRPCDTVGGDFYSFFKATEGVHAVAIGDISGHGIEAAMLVGLAKKLIEVHGRGQASPAKALAAANRDIFPDLDERTFVTACVGLIDTQARTFTYCRAGHDPLVIYNPRRRPPLAVLDSKGMALGMDEGPVFEQTLQERAVTLLPGDLVVTYTDGVTEAMNARNEQFGLERLYAVIEEHGRHEAEYVLWRIEKAVEAHRGRQPRADDMTLVAFKVLE